MNRLKELRTKYGLSLRKLQEYTGIDFSRLAVIEKTNANLETKTLKKLLNFFNVSDTYFFGNDGFIYYFDEKSNHYFHLPYEQYEGILTDDIVSFSIVDGSVRRIISLDGYHKLGISMSMYQRDLDNHIKTNMFIDFLESLDPYEFNKAIEKINEYVEIRKIKEDLAKKNV